MKKRSKIILSSIAVILVCAAGIIAAVFFTGNTGETNHFQSESSGLALTRNSLSVKGLGDDGFFSVTTDSNPADFTRPGTDNIFGITGNTVIVPGSMFAVEMTISGSSGEAFAYWLEIKINGELNELTKQLKVTVTADSSGAKTFYLGDGASLGSEENPVAVVIDQNSSSFGVCVEFEEDRTVNDGAQDKWATFDLIVHAVPYNG